MLYVREKRNLARHFDEHDEDYELQMLDVKRQGGAFPAPALWMVILGVIQSGKQLFIGFRCGMLYCNLRPVESITVEPLIIDTLLSQ